MDIVFSQIVLAGSIAVIISLIVRRIGKKWLARENWVRLLFVIPEGTVNPLAVHDQHEIALSAELYKRFKELGIPFGLEVVVQLLGEEIYFYIIVRKTDAHHAHQLIETLWPTGYLNESEDYDLWSSGSTAINQATGAYLTLRNPYSIPLKMASKGNFEPFLELLAKLSRLSPVGEGAAIQIITRPASQHLLQAVGTYLQKLESGQYSPSKYIHEEFIITPETVKLVRKKVSSPLFSVNFRIVTSHSRGEAVRILRTITDHLEKKSHDEHQQYNEFVAKIPKDQKYFINEFLRYTFEPAQEIVMSADELATYFHFPGPTTAGAKIKR